MADNNAIKSLVLGTLQEQLIPLTNAIASTTETAYAAGNGLVSGVGGGVGLLQLGNPGLYFGTGRELLITARGYDVVGATSTLTLKLYQIPASLLPIANTVAGQQTFTSWNLLATTTARSVTVANGQCSFVVKAFLQCGAAGRLTGRFEDEINGLYDVWAATTIVTGLLGEQDLNFALTATQSAGNAATVSTLAEFTLTQV